MEKSEAEWIYGMVENLTCEILAEMAGIRLCRATGPAADLKKKPMVAVCAAIGGDYTINMRFLAEKQLFYRLAQNMLEREPDDEEIQEYAMEFVNVVCGRVISEIINATHIKVRLMPVEYRVRSGSTLGEKSEVQTLELVSDEQEYVVFAWTTMAIEEMLRRSESNGKI